MIEKMLDQNRISQYQGYHEAHNKIVRAENDLLKLLCPEVHNALTELTDAYAALEQKIMRAAFREGVLAGIALIDDLNRPI